MAGCQPAVGKAAMTDPAPGKGFGSHRRDREQRAAAVVAIYGIVAKMSRFLVVRFAAIVAAVVLAMMRHFLVL